MGYCEYVRCCRYDKVNFNVYVYTLRSLFGYVVGHCNQFLGFIDLKFVHYLFLVYQVYTVYCIVHKYGTR